jgi:hypothetical protein
MDSIKADHGFNLDSKSVRNLLQTMSEFEPQQRRDFLQFITGSPKLPIGGTSCYTPHLALSFLTCILTMSTYRLQEPHAYVHRRLQTQRTAVHVGRLPAVGHDVRELPQDAGL